MTVIPIENSALSTVTKGLIQELEDLEIRGQVETIQTKALWRSVRILRRVLETHCHSNSSEKPLANAGMKNSQKISSSSNNNNNNNNNDTGLVIIYMKKRAYRIVDFAVSVDY